MSSPQYFQISTLNMWHDLPRNVYNISSKEELNLRANLRFVISDLELVENHAHIAKKYVKFVK